MSFSIDKHLHKLTDLRHHLHAIAEVSGAEDETARAVQTFLKKEAAPDEFQTGMGGNGLLATYESEQEGPHVLLRCELDGLPIPDNIDTEYQSETEGVGHKCGHDGHMSILCGVALSLSHERPSAGKVSLIFQPAEETGEGAQKVIDDQRFKQLQADYCFALHNLPGYQEHGIVVRNGTFAAASVGLKVKFQGQTAHAAHPEEGRSPALAVAQLIQALSSVPQFYSSLDHATKVTVVGATLGEQAFGTSPAQATVSATLRTYDDDLLEEIRDRCASLTRHIGTIYELETDHQWVEPFRTTHNDAGAAELIRKATAHHDFEVIEKETPFSWSEDFGRFTSEMSGAMFGLGIGSEKPALHAETYDFSDAVIPTGIRMFIQIINEVLSQE